MAIVIIKATAAVPAHHAPSVAMHFGKRSLAKNSRDVDSTSTCLDFEAT